MLDSWLDPVSYVGHWKLHSDSNLQAASSDLAEDVVNPIRLSAAFCESSIVGKASEVAAHANIGLFLACVLACDSTCNQ